MAEADLEVGATGDEASAAGRRVCVEVAAREAAQAAGLLGFGEAATRTGGRRRGGAAARGREALGCGAGVVESRRSSPESAGVASRGRERERRAGERESGGAER